MASWKCRVRIWTQIFEISTPKSIFGQFRSKKSKLSVFPENWQTWHLDNADSYSNISFLKFQPQTHFWANLGQKSQSWLFCLKTGTHVISRLLILVQHQFSEFQNLNPFLGKFEPKNSKLSTLAENWHTECLDGAYSYSNITFPSFQP